MLHFGPSRTDSFQANEDPAQKTKQIEPVQEEPVSFRSMEPASFRLDAAKQTLLGLDDASERKPLTFLANQFVQSIESFERKFEMTRQAVATDSTGAQLSAVPVLNCCESGPAVGLRRIDSPAQQSVVPSDDGSADNKTPSERHNQGQGCSTIPSDESLSAEQLRAYKELEQAEMACALKRMENCLQEERDRRNMLQQTFATELMQQKDAHSRDVAALEDMISKVLAENRRLSNMVEGLCGKAQQGGKSPSSTCASGNTTHRSKRSPGQSGSSGDDVSSGSDSRHKSAVVHRANALNKAPGQSSSSGDDTSSGSDSRHKSAAVNRANALNKERTLSNGSPHPMSSEAEHTTDSEQIASSDEAPMLPEQIWRPKPKTYTNID